MKNNRAPLRYAKALLDIAKDNGQAKEVNAHMELIANTIKENLELRTVLESPIIKSEQKVAILSDLFKSSTDALCVGLFNVLAENKRMSLLYSIAVQFQALYAHHMSIDQAVVTTAVKMDDKMEKQILAKIESLTGKKVKVKNIVDKSILGGFVLRIGDLQYDASIASKLSHLGQQFDTSDFEAKI
jgi:F-type H+-transporting ATPase subunit delta